MIFNTDGSLGFLHLVLIDMTTGKRKFQTIWQANNNYAVTYDYDSATGILTLNSNITIYGGVTCICGL